MSEFLFEELMLALSVISGRKQIYELTDGELIALGLDEQIERYEAVIKRAAERLIAQAIISSLHG